MAVPTFQAAATFQTGGAVQLTVAWPTHQADDVAFLFVQSNNDAGLLTANGFVQMPDSPQSGTGSIMSVWWCRATSGAMASPVTNTGSNNISATMITIRGAITTGDPWEVTSGSATAVVTSVSVPGDTTTIADQLIIFADGRGSDVAGGVFSGESATNVASLVEQVDSGTATGNGGGIGVWTGTRLTAGAYGPLTTTALGVAAGQALWSASIKPVSSGPQSLTGSLFTSAPTFFTGVLSSTYALTGTLYVNASTFFTGAISATYALTGTLFVNPPTFPTGTVAPGEVTVGGTLYVNPPTFFTGTVDSVYPLTGTLFVNAPTFPLGVVTAFGGAQNLTGSLFVSAPTFFTGVVDLTDQNLTGTLFVNSPTFPLGVISATYAITGTLFVNPPTFPTGVVTPGSVTLGGVLFVNVPTFFQGVADLAGVQTVSGVLFSNPAVFPTGVVSAGAVALTGSLFTSPPSFFTGTVASTYPLTGTLFVNAPVFFVGATVQDQPLTGILFSNPPTFFVGAALNEGGLVGVLFVNPPVFFVGTVGLGAPSFWAPNPTGYTLNPVAYTANPVAFVRVGPGGPSPWGATLSGDRFEVAPLFPVGSVS